MQSGVISDLSKMAAWFSRLGFLAFLGCSLTPETTHAKQVDIGGITYVDLTIIGDSLGMRGYWLEAGTVFRLSGRQTRIDFKKNSRFVQINQMPVYLGFSAVDIEGRLFIALADYQYVFQPILTPQVFKHIPRIQKVVIDVGHGGKDTGARNDTYGLMEKELVMDVSIRLKRLLEKTGFQVQLTRRRDEFIELEQRSWIANRDEADLFISLHFNSAMSSKPSGFEVFAMTPQYQPSTQKPKPTDEDAERFPGNKNDPWNMLAAYHIERALVQEVGGPDRGVKRARFAVLKYLECPGVLVELGFLSHAKTANKVQSAEYRQLLAQSLCKGVLLYRERLRRIR